MPLTSVDKIKINKYLKEHGMGHIYYYNMCDALGKRGKISDVEFLEYFTECVVSELRKSGKISVKHVTKLVSVVEAFLIWANDGGAVINDVTLDKIRSFKELYDSYLESTGMEKDSELYDVYMTSAIAKVDELYPCEETSESVSKYITQIAGLEEQVKKLERELAEANRLYGLLQKMYDEKAARVDSLETDIIVLEGNNKVKNDEVDLLIGKVATLSEELGKLNEQFTQLQEENDELKTLRESYDTLTGEFGRLQAIIDDDIQAKTAEAHLKAKHSKMEALMFQKLLFERVNVDNLVKHIKSKGITSDNVEVATVLREMKKIITMDGTSFSTEPAYKVVMPTLTEDGQFVIDVPANCKYYDVVLVSDFHIREVDDKVIRGFDTLNYYCVKNGINLVLNLGDMYHGFSEHPIDYADAVKSFEVVESSIEKLPQAPGVYHAVLGCNHEKSIARYGFDPVAMLARERTDFINLGYTHSTITINSPLGNLGCFDIHHPSDFDFPVNLDENGIDIGEMNAYLQEIYAKQGRCRDESYVDIFGHTHRSQFNSPGGYCYIPPYFEGGSKKGACHLRIYFDEDTDIKYMVFMPLSYNVGTRLTKTNEFVYQKVLKK